MDPVRTFEQLWKSSASEPDLFAFVRQHGITKSGQLLPIVLADQQQRWLTEKPLRVEDYLTGIPELATNAELILELAGNEFRCRRSSERWPSIGEYVSRFPAHSERLQQLLFHLVSAESGDRNVDSSSSVDSTHLGLADTGGSLSQLIETTQDLQCKLSLEEQTNGEIGNRPAHPFPDIAAERLDDSLTLAYVSTAGIGVEQKGRYRLDRVLGEGGFGRVYLGFDEELRRQVAIKVPTKTRFQKAEDAETYLAEARIVAGLDHPNIVPVYDMGRTEDGSIYVVSKFIEGSTLGDRIRVGRPPERETAQLLITVAQALHYAHQQRLIHRDIKPANILIESRSNTPYVADFGLAIREEDYLQESAIAGTPAYMSPEQARGEGHRLDGRSDVFALGVIFYQMLTTQKPFRGSTVMETLHQVISQDPRPPRELLDTIPAELERICLKALSKRSSDRYSTAEEFADDIGQWLRPTAAPVNIKAPVQVVPKGLRSFDINDADFFLDLLPGTRNRNGLPESVAFWKQRIEQSDPEQTFSVGLIYGPSGCGKSSLVKAGLLPHLSQDIITLYIEATAEDTETRILRGLRKRVPELSENQGLADTLATLRRSYFRKIVIIIDQFEQWLHAHRAEADVELVKALRQCDGGRVQAIVMVRDDFSVAASRLMNALDIPILQGQNFAVVDLFDVEHAAKVLTRFGQAFGKLPANAEKMSDSQQQFVNNVAAALAQNEKVVSVRLSLFAEMIKNKPWTSTTLKHVGGTQGIGVNFLDEAFSSRMANPNHRRHAVAAQCVLRMLLPELGSDIKGHMRSQQELLEASGYVDRPSDFADLLRILDGELRLITPTDSDGDTLSDSSSNVPSASRFYQFSHDYLVPSLREWLTRKQKETRRGRAEIKLKERTALWRYRPENRYLPTLAESLLFRVLTDSKSWSELQRQMIQKAIRIHGLLWGSVVATTLGLIIGTFNWTSVDHEKLIEEQARTAVDSIKNIHGPSFLVNLKALQTLPEDVVRRELAKLYLETEIEQDQLPLAFALTVYGVIEPELLVSRIDEIADIDTQNCYTALQADPTGTLKALRHFSGLGDPDYRGRVRAKYAVLALGFGDTELALEACQFENQLDPSLRTLFIDEFAHWNIDLERVLAAVKACDSPSLRSGICLAVGGIGEEWLSSEDKDAWGEVAYEWFTNHTDASTHSAAGWLLRQWGLPVHNDPWHFEIRPDRDWYTVRTNAATMIRIRAVPVDVSKFPHPTAKYTQWLAVVHDSANSESESAPLVAYRGMAYFYDDKLDQALEQFSRLSQFHTNEFKELLLQFTTLTLARLGRHDEANASKARYFALRDVALAPPFEKVAFEVKVLAWLGQNAEARRQLESALMAGDLGTSELYSFASAAAIFAQAVKSSDKDLSDELRTETINLLLKLFELGFRDAFTLVQDEDFAILHGDERFAQIVDAMTSSREFWACDSETTRFQFDLFMNDPDYPAAEKPEDWIGADQLRSPSPRHPVQNVSWYDAVKYCNWLSIRESLTPAYVRAGATETSRESDFEDWQLNTNSDGYRLLDVHEWQYACRAGTSTLYSTGNDTGLLSAYGTFQASTSEQSAAKRPNAWGLFDMHGNVAEWCNGFSSTRDEVRQVCGMSFFNDVMSVTSGSQSNFKAGRRIFFCGFRIGRTLFQSGQSKTK